MTLELTGPWAASGRAAPAADTYTNITNTATMETTHISVSDGMCANEGTQRRGLCAVVDERQERKLQQENYKTEMEESFRRLQREMMENMERMMERMITTMMTNLVTMLVPLIQGNKKAEAEMANRERTVARAAGEMAEERNSKRQVVTLTQKKIQQWTRPSGRNENSTGGLVERRGEAKEEKSTDPKHKGSTSLLVTAAATVPRRTRRAGPTQSATDKQAVKAMGEKSLSRPSVLSESETEEDDRMMEEQEEDIVLSEPDEDVSGVSARTNTEKNV